MPDKKLQVNNFQHHYSGGDACHLRTGPKYGIDQKQRVARHGRDFPRHSQQRYSNYQRVDHERIVRTTCVSGWPTKLLGAIKQERDERDDYGNNVEVVMRKIATREAPCDPHGVKQRAEERKDQDRSRMEN